MIEFATATFTLKDLAQFAGMAISLGGIVWFLARKLGAIESTLAKVEERQKNNTAHNNRIEIKVDKNTDELSELRERIAKLEAQK